MGKFVDLTGRRINNWKVIEFKGFNKHGQSMWLIECDCYKHTQRIKPCSIIKKHNDCGCGGLQSLVNKNFGRWIVLSHSEKDLWLCECQCEKKTQRIVDGRRLRSGTSQSCGCLFREATKKHNTYDLSGDYGIGWTTNTNEEFYFDLEDYEKIKDITWITGSDDYIVAMKDYKHYRMHRFILNSPDDKDVDHINRNRKDNRKNNLRYVSSQENSFNQSKRCTNTSGIIGVCWWKRDGNWLAQIKYNYKRIFLGYYNEFDDAVIARLKAEKEYFGDEYAPQRHLFKQYGL